MLQFDFDSWKQNFLQNHYKAPELSNKDLWVYLQVNLSTPAWPMHNLIAHAY